MTSSILDRFDSLTPPISIPDEFYCPINKNVMLDPVVAADNFTYDRKAIESWLAVKQVSPITNLPLPTYRPDSNELVKNDICISRTKSPDLLKQDEVIITVSPQTTDSLPPPSSEQLNHRQSCVEFCLIIGYSFQKIGYSLLLFTLNVFLLPFYVMYRCVKYGCDCLCLMCI